MPHFMIILIPYINLLNLSLIKMSVFEEYGAFKYEDNGVPSKDSAQSVHPQTLMQIFNIQVLCP